METSVQTGYFVVADISGYTSFMAETELLHAQEILRDLLDCVVERLTPTLTLAEIEGDAVFAYTLADKISRGETLLELIEATYAAFRDRLFAMQSQIDCVCAACQSAAQLDLKFVTHRGQYVEQHVAGKDKPVGSDINLTHRLLKNSIVGATGWRAYALFTAPTLEQLRIQPTGMYEGQESYEHLGTIKTHSLNLQAWYEELVEERRFVVTEDKAQLTLTQDIPAPPPLVWEWLHDPVKRGRWLVGTHWSLGARVNGRTGPGAENHCAHKGGTAIERILDWRPFDYFTSESTSGLFTFQSTLRLIPTQTGTRLQGHYQLQLPFPDWLAEPLGRFFFVRLAKVSAGWETLSRLVAEEETKEVKPKPIEPSMVVSEM